MCVGVYSGGWVAGQPHGKGRFKETGVNACDYQGGWRNGHLHGQGVLTFSNGRKFVPSFSLTDDPPHEYAPQVRRRV